LVLDSVHLLKTIYLYSDPYRILKDSLSPMDWVPLDFPQPLLSVNNWRKKEVEKQLIYHFQTITEVRLSSLASILTIKRHVVFPYLFSYVYVQESFYTLNK